MVHPRSRRPWLPALSPISPGDWAEQPFSVDHSGIQCATTVPGVATVAKTVDGQRTASTSQSPNRSTATRRSAQSLGEIGYHDCPNQGSPGLRTASVVQSTFLANVATLWYMLRRKVTAFACEVWQSGKGHRKVATVAKTVDEQRTASTFQSPKRSTATCRSAQSLGEIGYHDYSSTRAPGLRTAAVIQSTFAGYACRNR